MQKRELLLRPEGDEVERVLSVGQLGRLLKGELERATVNLSVEGEIASVRAVDSGHVYFVLRDEREEAAIDCVLYRSASVRAKKLVADGARLVVGGRVTFWSPRGKVQMIVETARLAGKGALLEALEKRRAALAAEGLFAPERKRRLPADPAVVGLVTSLQGAALHDILRVAFQRGSMRFVVAAASVQGAGAAEAMARGIRMLCKHPQVQAIILARGGGAADDLAAFNEEVLVRAVAACAVPIVSAVGHETDTTLADLAADVRAATPSQAAELIVPDVRARKQGLDHLRKRLWRAWQRAIGDRQQRVDVLTNEVEAHLRRILSIRRDGVARLERRVNARHPAAVLSAARAAIVPFEHRLVRAMRASLQTRRAALPQPQRLEELTRARVAERRASLGRACARLDAMSPLAVLGRGYAIVHRSSDRAVVRAATDVAPGDELSIRLGEGEVHATVIDPGDLDKDG